MNWTWHAFTIARIPIRLHWTLLFVLVYHLSGPIREGSGSRIILYVVAAVFANFAIILFHELGHSWATRRVGGHVDKIMLWPLGGMAYVGHSDEPKTDMFVAFCGPATHLILGGAAAAAILLIGIPWDWSYINPIGRGTAMYAESLPQYFLIDVLNMNAMLMAFNLFVPAFPLDGGRILLDFLRLRMGDFAASRTAGTISMVIGIGLLVLAIMTSNIFLGLIAAMVLLEAVRLRSIGPEEGFSPHGYSDRGYRYEERKEGYFERRRREKRERATARRAEEAAELRAKVDELLDKVNRGGINSLTPSERKTLEDESERLRGNE